ncbi:MAG: DsbA family protein [Pseudohongiellaceae bacterium]
MMNISKREAQRLRKEQKQHAAQQRAQTLRLLGKFVMFGVVPLLVAFAAYSWFSRGPTYSAVEIMPHDHILGDPDNPVPIVVYADFQCPACAVEHQNMSEAWPSIADRAYLVRRHFPIVGYRNTWNASLYAEAAARQGQFWGMHDLLYINQPIWSSLVNVTGEFDSYALELNLDMEQLHADIESEEVVQKIRNDQRSGNSSGVTSTPTLFIDGRRMTSYEVERIREEVAAAYAGRQ